MLILVLSLAILPLRLALAMPMDFSGNHCDNMDMAVENTSHDMKMVASSTEDNQTSHASIGNCCDKYDDDCTHCINSVSITEATTPLVLIKSNFVGDIIAQIAVHSRVLTPPTRPPLTLYI